MPYGTPISESDRIIRHRSIYGGTPPPTRIGGSRGMYSQEMNASVINENLDLIVVVGGLIAGWVFIEFVLPNITKE